MGSLAGSIFDLIEGNPTAGEQSEFGTLGNEQIGTGENLVTPAATYYEDILSGDPTKIAQSLAPEISAGQNQVEQQALTGSEFGTRSGGTTAANNAAEGQERGNIINLVGGLQQGAASAAGNLGTEQENMGSGNVSKEADLATQNRQRETSDINGVAQGAAQIATGFADPAAAADPYESLYNAQNADDSSLQPTDNDLTDLIQ